MTKEIRLGIDARLINYQRRGMANVLYNILLSSNFYKNAVIYLYFDRDITTEIIDKFSSLKYELKIMRCQNYFLWEQLFLPLRVKKDKIDVFWHPYNTGSIFMKPKQIVTINDVMYMKNYDIVPKSKNLHQKLGRIYRKFIVPKIAKKASKIITISKYSKIDILHEIKIEQKKIMIAYPSIDKSDFNSSNKWQDMTNKYNITNDYIFVLGGIDPRKNTEKAIEVFRSIYKKGYKDLQLVICGINNYEKSELFNFVQSQECHENVRVLGYIDRQELIMFYRNAKIFLFLSIYEGFGLPILEAMYYSTPVISFNITSIPEIANGAAILCELGNYEQVINETINLINNTQMRSKYISEGNKRVKKFSWETSTENINKVINDIIKVI